MITKNTPRKGSTTDDSDDERINRLIARYANIRTNEEQVPDCKTDKIDVVDHFRDPGQATVMLADPVLGVHYAYKILSTDSSENDNEVSNSRIQLTLNDSLYDSLCSHSHDSESSLSNKKIPSLKPRISKSRVTFRDSIKNVYQQTSLSDENLLKKSHAEKTTYCRPVNKSYDNHFVHKVMEKNAKLQLLLTKYVIERQKEKEKEKWNDYVKRLLEKRRYYRNLSTQYLSPCMWEEDINPTWVKQMFIDNKLTQSESCQEMLHDLYSRTNELYFDNTNKSEERKASNNQTTSTVYDNQMYCFPSTSRNSKTRGHSYWPCHRSIYGPRIMVSNEDGSIGNAIRNKMQEHTNLPQSKSTYNTKKSYQHIQPESKENKNIQTQITFESNPNLANYFSGEPQLQDMVSELMFRNKNMKHDHFTRERTRDRAIQCESEFSGQQLTPNQKMMKENLEREHEIFNNLFRSFMSDLKTENSNAIHSKLFRNKEIDGTKYSTRTRPSTAKKKRKVSIVADVMTNTCLSAFELQPTNSRLLLDTRFDQILYEELDKSNRLRSDIETMLNQTAHSPCEILISLDVPTRERSTEVTDSLSKTKLTDSLSHKIVTKDVRPSTDSLRPKQKTADKEDYTKSERRIAVNTEPVGLWSLLKLSSDSAKQILSFMPFMSRYLGRALLAPPSNYVCSACGAIFARPSELSAHILKHNFGEVRERSGCAEGPGCLFRCQYCGMRFTRWQCCELHQCDCARRGSHRHGRPSLVMLR